MRAHHDKTPYKVRRTWLLHKTTLRGQPSPYHGTHKIHSYCDAFVAALAHLDLAIARARV